METRYSKHMLPLWKLAGEIGTIGEYDPRYAEVYKKLSEALDEAEATGLITYEGFTSPRVIATRKTFGKDSRMGIHLLNPSYNELSSAIEDAQAKGFDRIYVHRSKSGIENRKVQV